MPQPSSKNPPRFLPVRISAELRPPAGGPLRFRPSHTAQNTADMGILDHRPLDPFADRRPLRRLLMQHAGHPGQFAAAVEHRHEADQMLHDGGLAALAAQLVVDAVEPFRRGVQPLPAFPFRDHRAAAGKPPEHGRYDPNVQARPRRNLADARRPPEIDNRQINAALGLRESLQNAAEILGMLIDQLHQLFQQFAHRPAPREPGENRQQTGAASGKYLQRPDFPPVHVAAGGHFPQPPAAFRVQRLQIDDAEQLEKRLPRIVQPLETTGSRGQQHDAGLRLKLFAQLPTEIVVRVGAQRLQVLDHEHKLLSQPVRRFQDGCAGALFEQKIPARPRGQSAVRLAQFPRKSGIAGGEFTGKVKQRFKPEIGRIEDLRVLFHEPHRKQPFRKSLVRAQFRGGAGQQHRFPAAAGRNEQNVPARRRTDIAAQNLHHEAELALAHHELPLHLRIGLQRSRIELADLPRRRFVHGAVLPPPSERRLAKGS